MSDEKIVARIAELKKDLGAIIVAHNYQRPEVQAIADFVGDSLELARRSTQVDAETIVFCGVHFMAETAAILNPERTVMLTQGGAGCPMADMISATEIIKWRERYPGAAVVCYVNSPAAAKAESDICCTSANGVAVVNSLSQDEVIFVPDKNLGHYVSTKTDKKIILYPGFCYVHDRIKPKQLAAAKERYPEAAVLVHPECRPEVVVMADVALSTSQMIRYARESAKRSFIIGTEEGILYDLRKQNPDKSFHLISNGQVCADMKKTTLETVLQTMERRENVITVPEEIRVRAKRAVDRMLEIG